MSSKLLNYPAASSNPHLSAGTSGSTAGTRNGTTSHGSAQLNFENLQLDDILCTVCQSVLVEPVFLPCQHRFCRNCLSGTIEKNNLNCPCCRKRFGTWYRNASRVNKLVHEQLWNAIQSQFRDYLDEDGAGRCNGNGSTGGCFVPPSESVIHLSEPGEIRKEYETELQRYRKELIEEKKKELAASEKYIINLYKQEGIIDLVDSSDHLSISSTTSTPEPETKRQPPQSTTAKTDAIHEVDDDEEAGPSGSSFPQQQQQQQQSGNNQKGNHPQQQPNQNSVISSSSNVHPSRPETTKSQSNGSVISISSTSSASAASSSCISSASSRYSLIKSDTAAKQQSKAQSSNQTGKAATVAGSSSSSGAVVKKVFTMAELNKSELCIKPTKLHRRTSSQAVDDDEDDDGDSLRSELNHFKPIIATTPKSCFSSKAVVRVPSVRPETGLLPPKTECFSPSKSPFKPIDPTTPRRSAFSVVNVHLFTPPASVSQTKGKSQKRKSTETSTAKKKKTKTAAPSSSGSSSASATVSGAKKRNGATKKTNGTTSGGTNRRKRKLKFSPQPKAKVKDVDPPKEVSSSSSSSNRVTRRSLNRESSRLKDLIVSDQQRREAMIEQERRDFEFAQKLQKKLNRTRGATMLLVDPLPKEVPTVARKQNSAYSLRRNSVAVVPTAAVMAPPPPPLPLPLRSTTSSIGSEASCRKRTPPKAETKSANPPPTTNAKKPKLQAASSTSTTTKQEPEAASSRVLRRSTRIRS